MKTKIIYISGSEVFNMADIRAAFDEVRMALNLDKNTVLFGVPVDNDDAGLTTNSEQNEIISQDVIENKITEIDFGNSMSDLSRHVMNHNTEDEESYEEETTQQTSDDDDDIEIGNLEEDEDIEPITSKIEPIIEDTVIEEEVEEVVVEPVKKRGRPRKVQIDITEDEEEIEKPVMENPSDNEESSEDEEKIIPIITSIWAADNAEQETEEPITEETTTTIEDESDNNIIEDEITDLSEAKEVVEETEPDLEKLLSGITPLEEDLDQDIKQNSAPQTTEEPEDAENVDATLEKLATEYAQAQDKISTGTKGKNKIGALRNILPFKQQKHKDTGLGDLFGWAGLAANDEEFSVPGFFTKKNQKK